MNRSRLILIFCLLACAFNVHGSHIVGGVMTYRCLSGNTYEVTLELFRDCLSGSAGAIEEDTPAIFKVYAGNAYDQAKVNIPISVAQVVPPNFNNECINNAPATCLQSATIRTTFTLPPNEAGYTVVYQRCCRNATVSNIINPGNTGATYSCRIPGGSIACNNSAVFNNFPPQIICVNNPLVYDHSATDPDGDSLSYEFCQAFTGGSDLNPKPNVDDIQLNPPPVTYLSPNYTFSKPMAGNPLVQINPVTGQISGTPNVQGRFVVTVCCHEWRDGVIINTVTREFQFVVTNCSKAVVANIPQYSDEFNTYIVECSGFEVKFDNLSTGGFKYNWNFGVPGTDADTSNEFSPTFTYPDTGVYEVSLVVNRGTTCPDSITRLVKIYPTLATDFSFDGLLCPDQPLQFFDESKATFEPFVGYTWNFGDGTFSFDENPTHTYDTGGIYTVSLVSKTIKGCIDTLIREVEIDDFRPFAANDTIIVIGESINYRGRGGNQYTWTPSTYLNNPNISNPTGYYPISTTISYIVNIRSEAGCEGNDTFTVQVVPQSSLWVPSAFSPNGDGLNDILKPISIGYSQIQAFRVFNRWGQEVFTTSKFDEGWDGFHQGSRAEIGTYFWFLRARNRFGETEEKKGDAILLR